MSQKIQEKKQTQEQKQQLDADSLLNKHIFNTLAYAFGGYAAGMGVSLFFKRKAGIPLLMAGAGAGYGLTNMYSDMNRLKQFQGQGGSSNTLKRDEQLGTKDWDRYQQKEQSLQTQKPRYGGSDSDDSDKSSGGMTSYEGSKKSSSKPQTETKSQSQSKGTDRHDTSKGGKSHEGIDSKKDQKQLFNLEGRAYDNRGDSAIQPKQHESSKKDTQKSQDKSEKSTGQKGTNTQSGSKGASSQGKESEIGKKDAQKGQDKSEKSTGQKGATTQSGSKGASSQGKESESGKKDTHKDEKTRSSSSSGKDSHLMTGKESQSKGGSPSSSSRPADIKGSKIGGDENIKTDKYGKNLSLDDTKAPGLLMEGTSRLNRRGGEQTEKVNEEMKERGVSSLPLQDKWGKTNKTGFKNQTEFAPENKAGGEFRGKTTAGSQVNAVIE